MPFFGVPIRNGLPIGLGSVAGFGAPQEFTPAELFIGGTAGTWYDPSDLTTMFTTAAGTTPVAMPGQGSAVSVGAMLDKRAPAYSVYFDGSGDVIESPNSAAFQFGVGDFTVEAWVYPTLLSVSTYRMVAQCAANSSWGAGWTLVIFGDRLQAWFNGSQIAQAAIGSLVTNTWQHVALTRIGTTVTLWINGLSAATGISSADLQPTRSVSIGDQASNALVYPFAGYISNLRVVKGTAVYTGNFTPPTAPLSPISGTSLLTCGTSWSGNPAITSVGNTRVDGLNPFTASPVGNHAIAINDSTARPELRARVNLLTYSEEFQNAYWTKRGINAFGSGSVANTTATLDPLGGNTADFIQESTAASVHGVDNNGITLPASTFIHSVYIKAATRNWAYVRLADAAGKGAYFNLSNGTIGTVEAGITAAISSVGNGWYRCSVSITTTAGLWYPFTGAASGDNQGSYTGDGTSGIYIWGADLRPANIGAAVPAYQRIADANTYDTAGFPLYLRFDGIDDGMYTPANLNLSATDKVGVFAGVRKLSDAATAIFTELSAVVGATNPGSFAILAPSGAAANNFRFTSSGTAPASASATSFASPVSAVLTGIGDIAGDVSQIRANGSVAGTNTADQGSGNYGTYPLYIGSRANSSLWLQGQVYGLVIVGSAVSAGNISATESWMAGKTGIVI